MLEPKGELGKGKSFLSVGTQSFLSVGTKTFLSVGTKTFLSVWHRVCVCGIGKEEYAYVGVVGRGSTGVELSGERIFT